MTRHTYILRNTCGPYILFLLALLFCLGPVHADVNVSDNTSHSSLTLFLQNDIFDKTDEQYTHGCGVSWMSREYPLVDNMPSFTTPFFRLLSFLGHTGEKRNFSLSLRQDIYTPKDISNPNLIKDDIPYAGITYFPIGFFEKGRRSFSYLELDIGLIGPDSYAGKSQEAVHKQLGNQDARGWDNQLRDEIILNLKYMRRWQVYRSNPYRRLQIEILPHIGSGIGNMKTFLNGGAQFRIGWPLPNDFGSEITQPSCECPATSDTSMTRAIKQFPGFLIYAFGSLDGQLVLRNIFLDGNTFRDSNRVSKKTLTGDAVIGVGLQIYRFKLSYWNVFQAKIYKTQSKPHKYGSLTVSVLF